MNVHPQRDDSKHDTADLIKSIPQKVDVVICDLADKQSVGSLVHHVTSSQASGGLGRGIDILVNCGGIQRRHKAEEFPDEDWQEVVLFIFILESLLNPFIQVLQVNLNTVWTLARDVGKYMVQNEIRGKIINIASLLSFQGILPFPHRMAFSLFC